jgi:hypothetical protein
MSVSYFTTCLFRLCVMILNNSHVQSAEAPLRTRYAVLVREDHAANKRKPSDVSKLVASRDDQKIGGWWNLGDANHGIGVGLLGPAASSVGFIKNSDTKWRADHNFTCKEQAFNKEVPSEEQGQCMGFCRTEGMRGIEEDVFKKHINFLRNVVRQIRKQWRVEKRVVNGNSRHLLLVVEVPRSDKAHSDLHGWFSARPCFSPLEVDLIHVDFPPRLAVPCVAKLCLELVPGTRDDMVPNFITMESAAKQLSHVHTQASGPLKFQLLDYSLRWDTPLGHLHIASLKDWQDLDEFATEIVDPLGDIEDTVDDGEAESALSLLKLATKAKASTDKSGPVLLSVKLLKFVNFCLLSFVCVSSFVLVVVADVVFGGGGVHVVDVGIVCCRRCCPSLLFSGCYCL